MLEITSIRKMIDTSSHLVENDVKQRMIDTSHHVCETMSITRKMIDACGHVLEMISKQQAY